jgi:hypothetical protein
VGGGVSFALPPCPSDQTQQYDNFFVTFTNTKGNKYVGEQENNKQHDKALIPKPMVGNEYNFLWQSTIPHVTFPVKKEQNL